jgi:hypothetical protein
MRRQHRSFAQDVVGRMLEPIAKEEGAVLVEAAVVEDKQELATVRTQALDGMRNATGKIPQITNAHVVDEIMALSVDSGDACRSVKHICPFSLFVPMQLANAPGVETHIDAGNVLRDAKFALGYLTRPAAGFLPYMRVGERKTQIG